MRDHLRSSFTTNSWWTRPPWLLVFAVFFLLALAVFAPAWRGEFIMDDWGYISDNRWLTSALSPLRFWTSLHQTDYWPLSYSVYWALWRLFGTATYPYHLLNIGLHALNAALLWQLLRRRGVVLSMGAALIFLLHPQQVQAVAWIFQLKTLLATALALGALLLLSRGRRGLALVVFVAALLAKSSVVMLPVFLLAYLAIEPAEARSKHLWVWLGLYFLASLVSGLLTIYVDTQHVGDVGAQLESWQGAATLDFMLSNLGFYLQHFFWPIGIAFLQPSSLVALVWPKLIGVGVVTLVVGFGFALKWRRSFSARWISGWLCLVFYLVNLLPALGLVQVPAMKLAPVANHWAYFANLGLAAMLGLMLATWFDYASSSWRMAQLGGMVACGLFLASASYTQAVTYGSEVAIWRDVVSKYPNSAVGYFNLGAALNKREQRQDAARAFATAIQLDSSHRGAHFNLAVYHMGLAQWSEAESLLRRTVVIDRTFAPAYINLGYVLWQQGRREDALGVLKVGLQAAPPHLELYKNLCLYLQQLQLPDEAAVLCPVAQAMEVDAKRAAVP
ncbi:MAG: tetratricopeptide repeat protein [Proteobacteria bacterium]|nr:tetratricopeptide repeat protein [Pseudomonadota bacterium]